MTFTTCWLGYDLPVDALETHPAVVTLRAQGIEKRGLREYHLLLAYFESAELEALNALVVNTEAETGSSLAETILAFDGYGIIEGAAGKYAYFSPSSGGAKAAGDLKARLVAAPFYDAAKNCRDLHVTIGGVDPLSIEKPKRGPLKQPFETKARLAFVGFDGKGWRRFFWNADAKTFVEDAPVLATEAKKPVVEAPMPLAKEAPPVIHEQKLEPKPLIEEPKPIVEAKAPQPLPVEAPNVPVEEKKPEPKPAESAPVPAPAPAPKPTAVPMTVKTLILPTKIMPDAACAVYLLRAHGMKLFPGAAEAELVFANDLPDGKTPDQLSDEGVLVVERRGESASLTIAKRLGIAERPELKKLLAYAKRDSEKKGTLSTDPLDRTFGLTGIAMMMNRVYPEDPRAVLEFLVSVFEAQVFDESRRPA